MRPIVQKIAPTLNVDVHMAGDIKHAANLIQRGAAENGMCVTLTAQTYVYTGGREEGFKVGFINYPRFPKTLPEIESAAEKLALELMEELGQHSFTIVGPHNSRWYSRREQN